MSRIRPTSSEHGVCQSEHGRAPYLTLTSEETTVRVSYTPRIRLGSRERVPGREFVTLTYRPEHARDLAKGLRLLLAAGVTDPVNLPSLLRELGFSEHTRE